MILLIDCDGGTARAAFGFFRYYGIPSERLDSADALLKADKHYSCAVLCGAEHIDIDGYIKALRTALAEVPILAITDKCASVRIFNRADGCLTFADGSLPCRINDILIKRGQPSIFEYKREGVSVDASCILSVKGKASLRLTKTEAMLMRLLTDLYPTPISAEYAVACIYPEEKRPAPAVIRTHICAINKQVEELVGLPLIRSVPREGYILAV